MRKPDNRQTILHLIRNKSPIGRAQIAKTTGLAIPSVMKIIDSFLELGLVREVGKGKSTGGKRPTLLEFVHDSYYSVGVDLGATNITCVLMDASNIVARTVLPTEFVEGSEHVLGRIIMAVENVLAAADIDADKVIGIGIAPPGLLDVATSRILFSPDIGWRDVDVISPLKKRFDINVFVDNATRATAQGEKIYGLAKDINTYMCINLGYGIGGAMVFDNNVFTGCSGSAGEIGHLTVIPDGPLCDCGNRGCLEAVSSARAMVRDAKERILAGDSTILTEIVEGDLNRLDAKTVIEAAQQGDAVASEIFLHATFTLGAAIAGVINLLDFEAIILEGGITQAGTFFLDNLNNSIAAHKMPYAGRNIKILVSELGANATAIGAASLVITHLLEESTLTRLVKPSGSRLLTWGPPKV